MTSILNLAMSSSSFSTLSLSASLFQNLTAFTNARMEPITAAAHPPSPSSLSKSIRFTSRACIPIILHLYFLFGNQIGGYHYRECQDYPRPDELLGGCQAFIDRGVVSEV